MNGLHKYRSPAGSPPTRSRLYVRPIDSSTREDANLVDSPMVSKTLLNFVAFLINKCIAIINSIFIMFLEIIPTSLGQSKATFVIEGGQRVLRPVCRHAAKHKCSKRRPANEDPARPHCAPLPRRG